MSLESDLNPRLELIRRLVRERYAEHLDALQHGNTTGPRIRLNEQGTIVVEPGPADQPYDEADFQETLTQWREDWQTTQDSVADLATLVRKFYEIDDDDGDSTWGTGQLEDIWRKLGIEGRTRQVRERGTGYRPPENGGTVYDEIAYARYYVDEKIYNVTLDITDHRQLDQNRRPGPYILESEHWSGPAAQAFFWNLCVPFDEAAGRQLEYVRALATIIHSFRVLRDRTTTDVRRIIDNCVRSLGGAGEVDPLVPEKNILDGVTADDANDAAGVVLAAIGLCMATGGAGITFAVLGVAQAAVGVALDVAKQEPTDEANLQVAAMAGGGSPYPVILSCQQAIGRLREWLGKKDEAIGRWVEAMMSATNGFNSQRLWLREPGGFSDDHQFELNSTTMREGVKAPINALDRAGRTYLRETTAGHYANAMDKMSTIVIPTWVFHLLPRSYNDYNEAHGGLVHLLRTTKNNLEMWGDELIEIAREYDQTDHDNAGNVEGAYN